MMLQKYLAQQRELIELKKTINEKELIEKKLIAILGSDCGICESPIVLTYDRGCYRLQCPSACPGYSEAETLSEVIEGWEKRFDYSNLKEGPKPKKILSIGTDTGLSPNAKKVLREIQLPSGRKVTIKDCADIPSKKPVSDGGHPVADIDFFNMFFPDGIPVICDECHCEYMFDPSDLVVKKSEDSNE